jgi:hypothetical protein
VLCSERSSAPAPLVGATCRHGRRLAVPGPANACTAPVLATRAAWGELRPPRHDPVALRADDNSLAFLGVSNRDETVTRVASERLVFVRRGGDRMAAAFLTTFAEEREELPLRPGFEGKLADLLVRFAGGSLLCHVRLRLCRHNRLIGAPNGSLSFRVMGRERAAGARRAPSDSRGAFSFIRGCLAISLERSSFEPWSGRRLRTTRFAASRTASAVIPRIATSFGVSAGAAGVSQRRWGGSMRFAAMGSRFCSKDTLRGRGRSGYFGGRRVLSAGCAPVVS